ncbi:MAG: hypothetical protein VYC34_04590 [Planctomycetota bacterium]|nr:hypothetical protein [Planctomycetota bacterium]
MSRIPQLLKLAESEPSDADVLYMLAQEHAKEGSHTEAITWYNRCLAVDQGYHYAYFHKARSLESMGEKEKAKEALRAGLERAKADGAAKAVNEITGYLAELG